MNPLAILALIASLKQQVNTLEINLAKQNAAAYAAQLPTSTVLGVVNLPPPLVYNGQDYANTPANQHILNIIQNFKNECIANGTPYGGPIGEFVANEPSCGTAITNEIDAYSKELTK